MLFRNVLPVAIAFSTFTAAIPPTARPNLDTELRLIKTSEADPGVWVTEDQKIEQYVAKNIHFIDITDIKVHFVRALALTLSSTNSETRMKPPSLFSQLLSRTLQYKDERSPTPPR